MINNNNNSSNMKTRERQYAAIWITIPHILSVLVKDSKLDVTTIDCSINEFPERDIGATL